MYKISKRYDIFISVMFICHITRIIDISTQANHITISDGKNKKEYVWKIINSPCMYYEAQYERSAADVWCVVYQLSRRLGINISTAFLNTEN